MYGHPSPAFRGENKIDRDVGQNLLRFEIEIVIFIALKGSGGIFSLPLDNQKSS